MKDEEQTEIPGFEQEKIPAIERWISKCDSKREMISGLEDELDNHEFKLREAMHENEDKVQRQEIDGEDCLVYERGDYRAVVKRGKEKVNYKIAEKSKGQVAEEN